MEIRESGENYLETILILKERNGFVRSIDVANELEFSKASVSRAMSILKEANLIYKEKNGGINLTELGLEHANKIYERHRLISSFLIKVLEVDEETASNDACKMEHILSATTFDKIKKYLGEE